MNLYFLVEGMTEARVYPMWLRHLVPRMRQVYHPRDVRRNHFYVFNACGYPSIIKKHLPLAIDEVNDLKRFDFLVVCFDADEESIARRQHFLFDFLRQEHKRLMRTQLVLCIQNCCIETWFLGNRQLFTSHPRDPLLADYVDYYNVRLRDPEAMGRFPESPTRQHFHTDYFKMMGRERGFKYRKGNPSQVGRPEFLDQLLMRQEESGQMPTLAHFLNFCQALNQRHVVWREPWD